MRCLPGGRSRGASDVKGEASETEVWKVMSTWQGGDGDG
jgi:hypothetical protein